MTAPNAFRADSARNRLASIDVRHATSLHATFGLSFSSMTSGSWGDGSEKRMGGYAAKIRGAR